MKPYYEGDGVTLYHGDCRSVLPSLVESSEVAAVIADPPYGETSLVWDRWPDGWVEAIAAQTVKSSPLWCFGSMRMFLAHGGDFGAYRFAQDVVWEKHNGSSFHADRFKRVHEHVLQWYRGEWSGLTTNPQFTEDRSPRTVRHKGRPPHAGVTKEAVYTSQDGGPKLARSVQFVRSMHGSAINETEKPVGILLPLIAYSSNPGDLILDPFAGSGSTLDAARQIGRRSIGIELREEQCEAAARRLDQQTLNVGGAA